MRAAPLAVCLLALFVCASSADQASLSKFTEWLNASGYNDERVEVVYSSEYERYGVVAAQDLKEGDEVFNIPAKFWLNLEQVQGYKPLEFFKDKWENEFDAVVVWLMVEGLNERSYWKPWFNILETSYHAASWWSDEEAALLEASPDRHSHTLLKRSVEQAYARMSETLFVPYRDTGLFPEDKFTFHDFHMAYSCAMTRGWGLQDPNKGKTMTMMPFSDMWNHNRTGGVAKFDGGVFRLQVTHDHAKGEPIFLNYGNKGNSNCFRVYGFALRDNPDNNVELTVQSDPTWPLRLVLGAAFLDRAYYNQQTQKYQKTVYLKMNTIDSDFLTYTRSSQAQWSDVDIDGLNHLATGRAISLVNEVKAIRVAMSVIQGRVAQYTTTVEEDRKMLENPNLPHRTKVAIIMRMEEKRILNNHLDLYRLLWNKVITDGALATNTDLSLGV